MIEGRAEAFEISQSETGRKVQPDVSVVTSPHKHLHALTQVPYVKDLWSYFSANAAAEVIAMQLCCCCLTVAFARTFFLLSKRSFPSGDGEAD